MEARDFRGIGRAAQEALRRRALFLIEERGLSQAQAAEAVGVQRQTVNIWLQRYRAQGEAGVLDGRRVSPRRGKGLLTADEADKVQGWIRDKTPGPAEAALCLVDQPGGARPDPAQAGQAARPVDGAALSAALGHDAAKAAGPGQGAPTGGDRRLAGAGLSGDRQAGQEPSGR